MVALSCLAGVYLCVDMLRHPRAPHALGIIGVLVALFGSLNLLAISLVGEYVGKILEETKRRPKFIRKALRHAGRHLKTPEEIAAFVRERQPAGTSVGARSHELDEA